MDEAAPPALRTIVKWRGDSMVCPQAFGGDIYAGCSVGCWYCFCRELEAKWNRGKPWWHPNLVRPSRYEDWVHLFETHQTARSWEAECMRHRLPFNMGSKAETFCLEDQDYRLVERVLGLFHKYKYPIIFETKTHLAGLRRYREIIKELDAAVIVAQTGGSMTLAYRLEPGAPNPMLRWEFVQQMNEEGIWTAVRWEPILMSINSSVDVLEDFAKKAKKFRARHVSFFNYRTSDAKQALDNFEANGFDLGKVVEANDGPKWIETGRLFFKMLRDLGVPTSSPDFVNFPFDSSCESCCGVDDLFPGHIYQLTFQHACRLIKERGRVSWGDMEAVPLKHPESYARMKRIWNGERNEGYYTMRDARGVVVLGKDGDGQNIYGRDGSEERPKTRTFF